MRARVCSSSFVSVLVLGSCGSADALESRVPEQRARVEQRTEKIAPTVHATPVRIEREPPLRLEQPRIRTPEIDCTPQSAVGYRKGKPFSIRVVSIDGAPVERDTANAFLAMREAAAADGVELTIYSAFRRPEEQQYFYHCYKSCSCNRCSPAAKPGFSNHQSGHALDIAVGSPDVHPWLLANAATFGFAATVAKEPWHWEFRGKPSKTGICR